MHVRSWLVALVLALTTVSCTSFTDSAGPTPSRSSAPASPVVTTAPEDRLTVLPDADPVTAAVGASRVLFASSPVVVVARAGDRAGTLLAASAAVGLGVPLLLEPADGGAADMLVAELDRLGAGTVLAVGAADGRAVGSATEGQAGRGRREVVSLPADPGAVAAATRLDLVSEQTVPEDGDAAAVAALEPGDPVALRPADAAASPGSGASGGELPEVVPAEPLTGTVVLSTGGGEAPAALATARAAGARVVLTGGTTDPRASADVLDALEEAEAVVALGPGYAAEEGLDWKLATAASGAQLPGGGQLLFPGRLLVALYGHPGTGALGVLGEQGIDASIDRAREHAAPYRDVVDAEVVPAFEIIATVATAAPGDDGNYSAETDPDELRPWVEAAGEAGLYVVLDLQPGRTDFVTQAQAYRSLLELPHVGLALDPEWRLGPAQEHLQQVGSVDVEEVNRVVAWLADLTRENALPQKLLVLHQFRTDMIPGRERLDTSRDELAVMIHADGQGSQADKQATWRRLHENPPPSVRWGWKNFYDEDAPMLTPAQTVGQVDPIPDLISYQ